MEHGGAVERNKKLCIFKTGGGLLRGRARQFCTDNSSAEAQSLGILSQSSPCSSAMVVSAVQAAKRALVTVLLSLAQQYALHPSASASQQRLRDSCCGGGLPESGKTDSPGQGRQVGRPTMAAGSKGEVATTLWPGPRSSRQEGHDLADSDRRRKQFCKALSHTLQRCPPDLPQCPRVRLACFLTDHLQPWKC